MGDIIHLPLTPRWTRLRYHQIQSMLIAATFAPPGGLPLRFPVVPAGRRSGKTEIAKRRLVDAAMIGTQFPIPRFFAGAPTRDQAKRIFWDDLKALVPVDAMARPPSESELTIYLINGSQIVVVGLDKPERIEGTPWDGGILDEFGNMKKQAWAANVRPALSDRNGWCWLIGVPEGRNHYYDEYKKAQAEGRAFTWFSADILPAQEIADAKRDLDELTFMQEYEASFVSFEGRAYYAFDERTHLARIAYNPKQPLIFCFDFNVAPGVAAVIQEKTRFEAGNIPILGDTITCIIGEVHIARNSNTPMVCRKLIQDWGHHEGLIYVYGDSTGGAKGSAKVAGSDWDLVRKMLAAHFGEKQVYYRIPSVNPAERARLNAMNSRLKSMDGVIRMLVDPAKAPYVVKDLEGVQLVPGGAGEIDKAQNPELTHLSDGIGYYVNYEFPVKAQTDGVRKVKGV